MKTLKEIIYENFFDNIGTSWESLFKKVVHKESTNMFWAKRDNEENWWEVKDHFLIIHHQKNLCKFDLNKGSLWSKLFTVYKSEDLAIWIQPMEGDIYMGLCNNASDAWNKEFSMKICFQKSLKNIYFIDIHKYTKLGYTKDYYHSKGSISGNSCCDGITDKNLIKEITGAEL